MIPDRTEASLGSKSSLDYAVSEFFEINDLLFSEKDVFVSNVNARGISLVSIGQCKYA